MARIMFRDTRLEGLADSPHAFASTIEAGQSIVELGMRPDLDFDRHAGFEGVVENRVDILAKFGGSDFHSPGL